VDSGCWNYGEAHELMHNLGGVQLDAPNTSGGGHCIDEYDEMCYDDDGNGPVKMSLICPSSQATLFDCNGDDYFLAATPAAGTYLASHWNTAESRFLINPGFVADTAPPAAPSSVTAIAGSSSVTLSWALGSEPDLAGYRVLRDGVQVASLGKVATFTDSGLTAGVTYAYVVRAVDTVGNVSSDSATISATPTASTTTETLSGSFKRTGSYAVTRTVQPGAARAAASGKARGKAASVTVTVRDQAGSILAQQSGTSIDLPTLLATPGAYTWTVSGGGGVSWTMTLTYVSS
jgi:hypothetical protein